MFCLVFLNWVNSTDFQITQHLQKTSLKYSTKHSVKRVDCKYCKILSPRIRLYLRFALAVLAAWSQQSHSAYARNMQLKIVFTPPVMKEHHLRLFFWEKKKIISTKSHDSPMLPSNLHRNSEQCHPNSNKLVCYTNTVFLWPCSYDL